MDDKQFLGVVCNNPTLNLPSYTGNFAGDCSASGKGFIFGSGFIYQSGAFNTTFSGTFESSGFLWSGYIPGSFSPSGIPLHNNGNPSSFSGYGLISGDHITYNPVSILAPRPFSGYGLFSGSGLISGKDVPGFFSGNGGWSSSSGYFNLCNSSFYSFVSTKFVGSGVISGCNVLMSLLPTYITPFEIPPSL